MVCKDEQFDFFFSNLNSFYFFSCLIALPRTSGTMLNKIGENGHPCLVSVFRGKVFSFFPFSIMLAVDLSYGLYYVGVYFFYA